MEMFASIEYASGITGQINVEYGVVGAPNPPHLMVCGSEGTLWQNSGLWFRTRAKMADEPEQILSESHYDGAVKAGTWHFLDCVNSDREPIVSDELARKDLEVVMGAYRSSEERQRIMLLT